MGAISEIDKNFNVETSIKRSGLKFFDAESEPFQIYGVFKENNLFRRMPEASARLVSEGIAALHRNTAGGRVRFVTDSDYVAISYKTDYVGKMPHFALTGSAGFDMYEGAGDEAIYCGTFVPPFEITNGYESVLDFQTHKKRTITINFPLYSHVEKLYIGLDENSVLEPADAYTFQKPIVFYGSSITQGACASRPGNSYQAIVSRILDTNFINLGFSGNAKGEPAMTDYINSLDMSIFVMDYDYNAWDIEELTHTHETMFKSIRTKHPDLPILIMSRPKFHLTEIETERLEIIKTTYLNAVASGDKNVTFISGRDLISPAARETATVDNTHPNDSGFLSMAEAIMPTLQNYLSGKL